jgi:hypothetical protein
MREIIVTFALSLFLVSCSVDNDEPKVPQSQDTTKQTVNKGDTIPSTKTDTLEKVLMVKQNDTVKVDVNLDGVKDFYITKYITGPCSTLGTSERIFVNIFYVDSEKDFILQNTSDGTSFMHSGEVIRKDISGTDYWWGNGSMLLCKNCYVSTGWETSFSYFGGNSYYNTLGFKVKQGNDYIIGWMMFSFNFTTGEVQNIYLDYTTNPTIIIPS